MATAQPKSGLTEYTISTGTGAVALTGPAPGYRGFVSSDDGLNYHYAIFQDQIVFETGVGTYNHSLRQLARTIVKGNINGTFTPLNLGAGTKEVSVIIPGELVAMQDTNNQFTADQFFNGAVLNLDADHDSWMDVNTDDTFKLYLGSQQALQANVTSGGMFTVMGADSGSGEGPLLVMQRFSGTPAANDALGCIYAMGAVSGGAQQIASKIRTWWTSVTAGAFSSMMEFQVAASGALQTVLALRPGVVSIPAGISLFSGGKLTTSATVAGIDIGPNGHVEIVCLDGNTPLHLCRGAGNGNYLVLYENAVPVSTVSSTAGVVTWQAFTGSHLGDFASDVAPEHDRHGTVLACTGSLLEATTSEPFYELRPAVAGDSRVLGVYGGRQRTNAMGGEERNLIVMFAIGNGRVRATGPIAAGDLLWVSNTPGVAEAQPDDIVRSTTIAKATEDSPEDGDERLISCIYMAG